MTQPLVRLDSTELRQAQDPRRLLGAFYTPSTTAHYMARWALRSSADHLLEPSFGDGNFLTAVDAVAQERGGWTPKVSAVELSADAIAQARSRGRLQSATVISRDFLNLAPFPVDAVIGNPPYVRLRHVEPEQRASALAVAAAHMPGGMEPSGSLWLPFALHAMSFLRRGGRMCLVLPFDSTYVRYARPFWQYLAGHFGSISVRRVRERLFPDLLQEVLILMADEFGGHCASVEFGAYDTVSALLGDRPAAEVSIPVVDIASGARPFIRALLSPQLRALLADLDDVTVPVRDLVTFNIGYVAGDKEFFHPSSVQSTMFRLPDKHLRPAVTSGRSLRGIGLYTSLVPAVKRSQLYLPTDSAITAGDAQYIRHGQQLRVDRRFKCRVRKPWYVVPGVRVPDLLLTVFAERPLLMINDGGVVASNSLLCGYMKVGTPLEFASRWYTSLTLLQCELEVHSLGGGVMVMVPGEAGTIRVPRRSPQVDATDIVSAELAAGRVTDAYLSGDDAVLRPLLELSASDIGLIHEGIQTLARWRNSSRTECGDADEQLPRLLEHRQEQVSLVKCLDHPIEECIEA